jgi:DNA-binding NtrC family response regulator
VIAATNRDLYAMKETGEFREDLYYRLASLVINLPTLRERPDDIARLARLFWKEVAPNRPALSADVIQELETYRWQGNARELRYIIVNLNTTFPKSTPNVERLRAVVRMRAPSALVVPGSHPDDGLVDRLRRLRRARVTIDGCHRIVRGLARPAAAAARGADEVVTDITARLTELQLLGTPAAWFSDASVKALHRLAGSLAVFQGALRRHDRRAARQEVAGLAADVAAAAAAVRRDEERILKSL